MLERHKQNKGVKASQKKYILLFFLEEKHTHYNRCLL